MSARDRVLTKQQQIEHLSNSLGKVIYSKTLSTSLYTRRSKIQSGNEPKGQNGVNETEQRDRQGKQ